MNKTKPDKDEIDWLIILFNTVNDEEIEKDSLEKLYAFGLDDNQIVERYQKLKSDEIQQKAFDKAWEKQKERNQFEKYTTTEKIKIFLWGPFELFKFYDSGLTELKKLNYKTKFRQRLTLLISGTVFWIVLGIATFQYYEYKRMQEIEKVDITDWENNRVTKE